MTNVMQSTTSGPPSSTVAPTPDRDGPGQPPTADAAEVPIETTGFRAGPPKSQHSCASVKPRDEHEASDASMPTRRVAVLVLGMHRSGTSALTRVINLLGADLPSNLMPPAENNNEAGFWESLDVFRLNDEILDSAGSTWDDWRYLNPDWTRSPAKDVFMARALEILKHDFGRSSLFVLKDPRICRLLPFWLEVLEAFNSEPRCVLPVRSPLEVAASLKSRDNFSPALSHALWLRHVLDAEYASRGLRRAFVKYDELVNDWRATVLVMTDKIGLAWPRRSSSSEVEIDRFLDNRHRHHTDSTGSVSKIATLTPWVRDTYSALNSLHMHPESKDALECFDRVRAEFNRATNELGAVMRFDEKSIEEQIQFSKAQIATLEQAIAFHQEHSAEFECLIRERDSRIHTLEQAIAALRKNDGDLVGAFVERDSALNRADAAERRVFVLEAHAADLEGIVRKHAARIGSVEKEVAAHKTNVNTLECLVSERDASIDSLEQALTAHRAHAATLERIVGERDARIDSLEQALTAHRAHAATLECVVGERDARIDILAQDVDAYQGRVSGLTSTLESQLVEKKIIADEYHRILRRLDAIHTSPSWQLAGILRAIESRWPRVTRGIAAVPKLAWSTLRFSLLARLRLRRQATELLSAGLFDRDWYIRHNPELVLSGYNPVLHWLVQGWLERRNPNPLFDLDWYLNENAYVISAGINPLVHYLISGAREGRNPNPLFHSDWYLSKNPDVAASGINPLAHYLRSGAREGCDPNPLFDSDWYLTQNPDVYAVGLNPLEHYLTMGAREGRDPHPLFDSDWYLAKNPDVAAAGLNPLVHYLVRGAWEGRDPNPLFDSGWYLEENPDVADAGLNPLAHYCDCGAQEGRNPNPFFDSSWYLASNPDVAAAGLNPLAHYIASGASEGRDPGPSFRSDYYLALNPEAAAAGANPLAHYLSSEHARQPTADSSESPSAISSDPLRRLYETMLQSAKRFPADNEYVPETEVSIDPSILPVRLIAFYLPQFHPIPENDAWWGKGFTEWTNVSKAVPQFEGHYQPRLPDALGFYDLRVKEVQREQIRLARKYGIYGFCYHHYWFRGKRLLERPLQQMLDDPTMDFPFCICWANENWTRRWDGHDEEILIGQEHSLEDDLQFIAEIERAFRDPRYIRIQGRPLLIVYRPSLFPDPAATAALWRKYARDRGMPAPYLVNVLSFPEAVDPGSIGYDAAVEFPPHQYRHVDLTGTVSLLNKDFQGRVYDYRSFIDEAESKISVKTLYETFPGVMTGWDNTPRRLNQGTVFANATPSEYRRWLTAACRRASLFKDQDKRLVFINAWNEWAEGTYLEPDRRFGFAYLKSTYDVLTSQLVGSPQPTPQTHDQCQTPNRRSVLLIGHDAHKHGAQLLALHLTRLLSRRFGLDVIVWLLDGGDLMQDYQEVAEVHLVNEIPDGIVGGLSALRKRGVNKAITNTVVTGELVPKLKEAGFSVVSLVHEMPRLILERGLTERACALAEAADRIIFAADAVRRAFMTVADFPIDKSVLLPQGLYQRLDSDPGARRQVETELGLPQNAIVVMNAGFGDLRKGFDTFMDCARDICPRHPRMHFIWIGTISQDLLCRYDTEHSKGALATNLHVLPFSNDVGRYFAAADVFLLTSREDPFPSVVLEALACGLPVVAFDGSGGHCEILKEPLYGKLADPSGGTETLETELIRMVGEEAAHPERSSERARSARNRYDFPIYGWNVLQSIEPPLVKISVIVPNYDYACYLSKRLETIFLQTHPIFELIVLDDASSDDSPAVVIETCQQFDRVISLIRNQENSGSVFKQWAKGIREARGDLIWIAEADDLAEPRFLEELAHLFAVDPKIVFAFSDSSQIDSDGKQIGESYALYCNDLCDIDFNLDFTIPTDAFLMQCLSVKNTILNVSSVVFRRDALIDSLNAVEPEMSSLFIAGDWRLYIELCLRSGNVGYIAKPLNAHRRHNKSVVGSSRLKANVSEIKRIYDVIDLVAPPQGLITARQLAYLEELNARMEAACHGWPHDVKELCKEAALPFDVTPDVHAHDHIFRFIYDNPVFENKAGAVRYYFQDGHTSATKVRKALDLWLIPHGEKFKVLEFASGYGAVTRHARDVLLPHDLHSCDIHPEAVEFLSAHLGVTSIQSSTNPDQLQLPVLYDMIFVLSFFSHMPASTWLNWLRRLYLSVKEGGVLLFTTHGEKSMKYLPQARLDENGFWFEPTSEQTDLDTTNYGQTITSKSFVSAQISKLDRALLLDYQEGDWWGHQDVYILRKGRT